MGVQQMGKIAAANFLRKMMQLILLVLLFHWMEFDVQMSIFIAICTLVGSDLIVLLYLFHMFVLQMRTLKKKNRLQWGKGNQKEPSFCFLVDNGHARISCRHKCD